MPVFMILFYFITTIGAVMIALSLVGAIVWVIEMIQDKIEEWRRR